MTEKPTRDCVVSLYDIEGLIVWNFRRHYDQRKL